MAALIFGGQSCIQMITVSIVLGAVTLVIGFIRMLITPTIHDLFGANDRPYRGPSPYAKLPTNRLLLNANISQPEDLLSNETETTTMLAKLAISTTASAAVLIQQAIAKNVMAKQDQLAAELTKKVLAKQAGSILDQVLGNFFTPENEYFTTKAQTTAATTVKTTTPPTTTAKVLDFEISASMSKASKAPIVRKRIIKRRRKVTRTMKTTTPTTVERSSSTSTSSPSGKTGQQRDENVELYDGQPVRGPVKRFAFWW